MAILFLVLAIVFFILWRKEKKIVQTHEDLKAAKAATNLYIENRKAETDQYVEDKKAEANQYTEDKKTEANSLFEAKKREALDYYWKKTKNADERLRRIEQDILKLTSEKSDLLKELEVLNQEVLCATTSIDTYSELRSDEIKNKLALLKTKEDECVKSGAALIVTNDSLQKKVVDSQKKQILRCFNSETASIIGNVTVNNIDSIRSKLQRSYDTLNKVFAVDGVQISQSLFAMKLEEMSLVYAYMVKVEEEKEQKKAIREQMVEEEKVRREIEREKQKIEKEENQFSNEVKKLMGYMQKAKDDIEKQLYVDKIQELEEKLKSLSADKENVLQREQNTRAGFVYIISNIGSFGENVYKIGMTRRLDPMDRISELSSASVPFPFDVHALIFSEDAPALETLLHHHFQSNQVNKVNARKEFFRIDLDEIKKLVIENHNATVQFVDIPDATEYRETLRIEAANQKN